MGKERMDVMKLRSITRTVVFLGIVGTLCYLAIAGEAELQDRLVTLLGTILGTVVVFYFKKEED
jgi:phage-related holin